MATGMRLKNTAGTVMIDDKNPSLALRQATVLSSAANTEAFFDIPATEFPCVAVRPASDSFAIYGGRYVNMGGTSRRYFFKTNKPPLGSHPPMAATAYVFDRPLHSGKAQGLRLKDGQGRITFDSGGKYGRVAHVFEGNGVQAMTAGRAYACSILQKQRIEELVVDSIDSSWRRINVYETGFQFSGSSIFVGDCLISDTRFPSSQVPYRRVTGSTPRVLVLDVTGY